MRTSRTRLSKIAELDAYLAELDAELGPVDEREAAAARVWADRLVSGPGNNAPA